MFMHRNASALWTAKPVVLLFGVATPRAGPWLIGRKLIRRFFYTATHAPGRSCWAGGCIEAFLEGARFVGVDSLDALVDCSVSSPSAMRLVLAGVRFSGRYGREWEDYLRGKLEMGARMKFPKVEAVRRDDLWIQISPAYMLLPFDETKRTWQRKAHTLLKHLKDIPTSHNPHSYISLVFPEELRALAAKGYVWAASIKSRDRYNDALAEWLYWLDHVRMPHIDATMGKFTPRSTLDTAVLRAGHLFGGKIGALILPPNR
jgi:hypothetical protein